MSVNKICIVSLSGIMAAGGVSDDFDVEAWNPEEVAKYFSEKGLQTFAELCEPNDIDGTVLINTSYDELRNLGLTFGIAKKVLLEIRKLKPCGKSSMHVLMFAFPLFYTHDFVCIGYCRIDSF